MSEQEKPTYEQLEKWYTEAVALLQRVMQGSPNFFTSEIVYDPSIEDLNTLWANIRTFLLKQPAGIIEAEAHQERSIQILVNGMIFDTGAVLLDYDAIVHLARTQSTALHTVTYRKGPASNPEGSLIPGQAVRITDGMAFNARVTNNA